MTREKLIRSKEYHLSGIQLSILDFVCNYKKAHELTDKELAKKLDVKDYCISQIMNGDYDRSLRSLVLLAMSCNMIPVITFVDIDEYVNNDEQDKVYVLTTKDRERNAVS